MPKNSIYLGILLLIISSLFSLPFIKLPVSASARGVVRSVQENTQISAVVSGKIIQSKLEKNNQHLNKGDTLLVITAEQLDTQKNLQHSQSADYAAQLADLQKISRGNFSGLQTGQYQREVSVMREKIAQVQTQLSLAKKDLDRANLLFSQGVIPAAEHDNLITITKVCKAKLQV